MQETEVTEFPVRVMVDDRPVSSTLQLRMRNGRYNGLTIATSISRTHLL